MPRQYWLTYVDYFIEEKTPYINLETSKESAYEPEDDWFEDEIIMHGPWKILQSNMMN